MNMIRQGAWHLLQKEVILQVIAIPDIMTVNMIFLNSAHMLADEVDLHMFGTCLDEVGLHATVITANMTVTVNIMFQEGAHLWTDVVGLYLPFLSGNIAGMVIGVH